MLNPLSYLQNGNILAARIFIQHLTSALPSNLTSGVSSIPVGDTHEVTLTKDPIVNFSQMAVLTCQRAQGDKNKVMRESWVRLCGTYQSKGGILASKEVRQVRLLSFRTAYMGTLTTRFSGSERAWQPLLCYTSSSYSSCQSAWRNDVIFVRRCSSRPANEEDVGACEQRTSWVRLRSVLLVGCSSSESRLRFCSFPLFQLCHIV